MRAKDTLGRAGEDRADAYLRAQGWRILDRNWRCRQGEADFVADDGVDIVVVEVKTRSGEGFGHPLEAIDDRKRERMWRVGRCWMREHDAHARGRRLRLDAIALTGRDPATARLEHVPDLSW